MIFKIVHSMYPLSTKKASQPTNQTYVRKYRTGG
nr:MAG TPA: hypothetical protein [Caudoviricetes sp.]